MILNNNHMQADSLVPLKAFFNPLFIGGFLLVILIIIIRGFLEKHFNLWSNTKSTNFRNKKYGTKRNGRRDYF